MSTVFKIAGGIFFGFLMLWFFSAVVFSVVVRESTKDVQAVFNQTSQRLVTVQRLEAVRRAKVEAAKQAAIDREAIERNRTRIAELEKAQAWAAYWSPSAECLATASVECGNQHIRAKREFERRYAAGEL